MANHYHYFSKCSLSSCSFSSTTMQEISPDSSTGNNLCRKCTCMLCDLHDRVTYRQVHLLCSTERVYQYGVMHKNIICSYPNLFITCYLTALPKNDPSLHLSPKYWLLISQLCLISPKSNVIHVRHFIFPFTANSF